MSGGETSPERGRRALKVLLAAPRGFCAGVDRAILIVERALAKWGRPVYVRHEIVHNRHVVERLTRLGAVFVEELDECPTDRPVVFSAHGVPKAVPEEARRREMLFVDATCPLVSKVHVEAERHFAAGREVLLVGHAGHPEVVGTIGQLPAGAIAVVETVDEAEMVTPRDESRLAYVTQTTLSVADTADIVAVLHRRFPQISGPHKEDICYATANRQRAVQAMARDADLILVIGAPNSSNSQRLVEVARQEGAKSARLIQCVDDLDWAWLDGVSILGLTAGASAPEVLVQEFMDALGRHFEIAVEEVCVTQENVAFRLPRLLEEA